MANEDNDQNEEFFVMCPKDFPRCFMGGGMYASGFAVRASECPCEVARAATAHLLPKVTLKEGGE